MADQLQLRGGTTNEHSTFTGALREVTVDTDKDTLIVHDAATAGGHPLLREDGSNSALSLGTAGTPSLKFTGDANTGIYSPGADQVAISTGGSGRLFVDGSGRVGVGSATPTDTNNFGNALDVNGTAGSAVYVRTNGSATNFGMFGHSGTTAYVMNQSNGPLTMWTNNNERLRITSDGNVGVGISTPTSKLHVFDPAGTIALQTNANTSTQFRFQQGTTFVGAVGFDNSAGCVYLNRYGDATQGLAVDSSGRVGIGTTTVDELLHIEQSVGNYGPAFKISNSNASRWGGKLVFESFNSTTPYEAAVIKADGGSTTSSGNLIFETAGSEAFRVDSSRRVLVGTSTARSNFYSATPELQLEKAGDRTRFLITGNANTNQASELIIAKTRGTTVGSNTVVQSGDNLGNLHFAGADGTNLVIGAAITAWVDGTPGSNDMPGRLIFSTTADGASSPTERMRIDSSGRVGIGTTSPGNYNAGFNQLVVGSSGDQGVTIVSGTSNSGTIAFADGTSGADAYRGYVQYQHGSTNALVFATDGSERARIDSSGRLLVGTSSSAGLLNNTIELAGQAGGSDQPAFQCFNFAGTSASGAGYFEFFKSRGSGIGSNVIVADGDGLGYLRWYGADGTGYRNAAQIAAQVDGTPGANDMPGRLVFSTTADGASSPTERMRIVSNGRLDLYSTDDTAYGQFARMVRFGYGTPYKCLMLGGTETASYTSISLGYNVANNSSGAFNGDGREVVVQNNTRIISPDAADTGFAKNIQFNQLGHGTVGFPNGIGFGTDTSSTNVLDDYEEGTWTVSLYDAQTGGNQSSSTTVGLYTKIGRVVNFQFSFVNIETGGLTGANTAYFNLPFSSNSSYAGAPANILYRDINWAGSQTEMTSYLGNNKSRMEFYVQGDNQGYAAVKINELSSGATDMYVAGTYMTA